MNRRSLLAAAGFVLAGNRGLAVAATDALPIKVYLSPACGCCKGWIAHLEKSGFTPAVAEVADVAPQKKALGVPETAWSCHTAVIGGYFIEGHVPASDVRRLLAEKPRALGLAIPGMPVGSPGMEVMGQAADRYDTMLLLAGGASRVWERH